MAMRSDDEFSLQLCSCFAILRVPMSSSKAAKTTSTSCWLTPTSNESSTSPTGQLLLYLLQPIPQITTECAFSVPSLPARGTPASSSLATFHQTKEPYLLNHHLRLALQGSQPTGCGCSWTYFSSVLDRSLNVQRVENWEDFTIGDFNLMTGRSFLDFIAVDDLLEICSLLSKCTQENTSKWTSLYQLRIPPVQSAGNFACSRSKFVWVRSLFIRPSAYDTSIRCLHQLIGDAEMRNTEAWFLNSEVPSNLKTHSPNPTTITARKYSPSTSLQPTPVDPLNSDLGLSQPIKILRFQPSSYQPQKNLSINTILHPVSSLLNLSSNNEALMKTHASSDPRGMATVYESYATRTPSTLISSNQWLVSTSSGVCVPIMTKARGPPNLMEEHNETPGWSACEPFYPCPSKRLRTQQSNQLTTMEKLSNKEHEISPNLPDILQELTPETLAMLEEHDDIKTNSLSPDLCFDDILSSIPPVIETTNSDDNQDKLYLQALSEENSTSSPPPSLPESVASSYFSLPSVNSVIHVPNYSQHMQLKHSENEPCALRDVDLDLDMFSDAEDFLDVLVSDVMNLPSDSHNLRTDVR